MERQVHEQSIFELGDDLLSLIREGRILQVWLDLLEKGKKWSDHLIFLLKNKLNAREGPQSKAQCETCLGTIFQTLMDAITALYKASNELKIQITDVEEDLEVCKVLRC